MMKALLAVRFRALFVGMMTRGRKKKNSAGMTLLFLFLYLYLAAVVVGMMVFLFHSLAVPYHTQGLDWLYFSMAGMMGLFFSVLGSVFTTQSQLYDAKDNSMLLSMPLHPWQILLSRMLPLLALNLLFTGIVMLPASIVYGVEVGFSAGNFLAQLLALLAVCVLAQAIACLLGWLLHLLLSKLNKSFASMLYMVVFLGIYFYLYSQMGTILNKIAANGEAIATTFQAKIQPLYILGLGCTGNWGKLLIFLLLCSAVFGLVYWILSVTFLRTVTSQRSRKKRKLDLKEGSISKPSQAIVRKEFKKFLGCPVYLTNMGLGIVLTAALPVAGLIFRDKIMELFSLLPFLKPYTSLIICAFLSFTVSTIDISTPSVSLEGKNIWILKSMPLSGRAILEAKLRFHMVMAVPVTAVSGLILAVTFGCSPLDAILVALTPGLLAALCGFIGMICGLQWARLDYISEAYPCKQSVSVLVTIFAVWGIPVALGLLYGLGLAPILSPTVFLFLTCLLLLLACWGLHRMVVTWGAKKWDAL